MNLDQANRTSEALTPREEMPRAAYGSLIFGPPQGEFCQVNRKCLLKEGHTGSCWPQ